MSDFKDCQELDLFVFSTIYYFLIWTRHFAKCQKDLDVCSDLCLFTCAQEKQASRVLLFCLGRGSFEWGARRREVERPEQRVSLRIFPF